MPTMPALARTRITVAPRFDEALRDISRVYDSPRQIAADPALSAEQKAALLRQWDYDLFGLQVATNEAMPSAGAGPGWLVAEVRACLRQLGAI